MMRLFLQELVGGKVNKKVGEHQREEEHTPTWPNNADCNNESEEDCDELPFLH